MVDYPSLTNIDVAKLIAEVGGDPWRVDATLQSGDAGQIAELATAFRDSAACTTETWNEFAFARARFQQSWDRQNGEYPINDSAEVQRAITQLHVQAEQLPHIAVDLQNIAADLAEAQRMCALKIDGLNIELRFIDGLIGDALANDEDTSTLEDDAIDATRDTLSEVDRLRDAYADRLQRAQTDLRLHHGYDPAAIEDVDGDGEDGPAQRAPSAVAHYDATQRAKDEALVNAPGEMTPEKADAAARLRDFATVNDPAAAPEARQLAAERLDDFRMANYVGPLPIDPILGQDGRTRARSRLDLQRQLEAGYQGALPPMTADEATTLLDNGEQLGRVFNTKSAYFALSSAGMSREGCLKALADLVGSVDPYVKGAEAYGHAVRSGGSSTRPAARLGWASGGGRNDV